MAISTTGWDVTLSGGLFLSRVAFAGDDEAYLCLRRLLGHGDSDAWIRANSWDAEETPWQDRWDAPLAREPCDLVRLQRTGKSWRVLDAIDLADLWLRICRPRRSGRFGRMAFSKTLRPSNWRRQHHEVTPPASFRG